MNLPIFDEKWYPMLASRAIGERELGHDDSAERWEELCRDFRALAKGDALDPGLLLVRVQELTDERDSTCAIHGNYDPSQRGPGWCPYCTHNVELPGSYNADLELTPDRRVQEAERVGSQLAERLRMHVAMRKEERSSEPDSAVCWRCDELLAEWASLVGGDVQEQETTTDSGDESAIRRSGGDS